MTHSTGIKMNIETKYKLNVSIDSKTATLSVIVVPDWEEVGSVRILSGPTEEVKEFFYGRMTLQQVREAWRSSKR
jgi:hypothetical protein